MKKILLLSAVMLMSTALASAVSKHKIAGSAPAKYTIVYDAKAEPEVGKEMAMFFQNRLKEVTGVTIPVVTTDQMKKGKAISFSNMGNKKAFDYGIKADKKGLTISGGGCWAMQKACNIVADELAKKDIPVNYSKSGSVQGEYLFPRRSDVNLRILDDNIWDYSQEVIPEPWVKLGVDPRDDYRAPRFAQLVRAYMPDVVTIQEYNKHMHDRFYPLIQKYGYEISYESGADWNNTPIFYKKDAVELVEVNYNLYTPKQWSNSGSKSFQSAVFKHKDTGKTFAVLNTHLWWKGDAQQPGSTQARAAQVRLMLAEAEILKAKYDCVIFVTGDMNCYENDIPIRQFLDEGFVPCYKAATVYGNKDNGHHICGPKDGFSRTSRRPSPERAGGALDHCFIFNHQKHNAEVKIFECIQAYFTVELTDHYPNLIDARL